MEENNEKLLDTYPLPVTIEQIKTIEKQLENCICKIFITEGGKGTGFFCNIKYNNSTESLPVLITNNHILNENNIKSDQIIKISFLDKEQIKLQVLLKLKRKKKK